MDNMTNDHRATNLYNESVVNQELAIILKPLQVQLEPISKIAQEQSRRIADLIIPVIDNVAFKESMKQAAEIAESMQQSFAISQIQDLLKNISEMTRFNQEVIKQMAQPIIACSFQANLSSMSLFLQDKANTEPPKSVFSVQTKSIEFLQTRAIDTDDEKEAPVVAGQVVRAKHGAVEFCQEQSILGTLIATTPEQMSELKHYIKANMSDKELEEELERRGGQLVVQHISSMSLIRQENPILVINGKEVEFGISTNCAAFVMAFFGKRKNWSKVVDRGTLMDKIFENPITEPEKKHAKRGLDECVRQINRKVGRALTGETNLIIPVKRGFRVNPELLK